MIAFPITATIPATASRNERSVVYTACTDRTQPHDGTLVVTEWMGSRVRRSVKTVYHVQEEPAIGVMGRVFLVLLHATTGLEGTRRGEEAAARVGSVYRCCVKADGSGHCTCPAGETRSGDCVHYLALRELIETGRLEHPLAYLPPEPVFDSQQDAEIAAFDVPADRDADRPFPPEPCFFPPGSEKRMAVMAQRARSGFKLWHPDDLDW